MATGEVITLQAPKPRALAGLAVAGLVALAAWFAVGPEAPVGLALLIAGGGGVVGALALLAPTASFLRLAPDGLTITQLYKTFKVRWTDLGRFGVADVDGGRRVVFLYDSAYRRGFNDRRFAVVLKGFEAALPGNYGKPPDKLAAMLNHYMERYKGQASR